MYIDRVGNDYGSQKTLTPSQENYYSTITKGKEFLNITALVKTGPGDMHLAEPMYIDIVERSAPRKTSPKKKCLVAWLVMLTIISLASLAFTTVIFYSASVSDGKPKLNGNSNSHTNVESPSLAGEVKPSSFPLRGDYNERIDQLSKNMTFLLKKVANVSKMPGPRGPRGFNGITGPQGPRGYNGNDGTPGAPGIPGSMGPPGFNGSTGPKGATGSQGPAGPRGAGNFSSCILGREESLGNPGTDNDASISDVVGKEIISATCYSDDAINYDLSKRNISEGYEYTCICKGTRNTGVPKMLCAINYWQCEL